jgi:tellurium resistance protein TerD
LELTSIAGFESDKPVIKLLDDTIVEDVEIFGGVADMPKHYIPRVLHLGKMLPHCVNVFKLKVYIPETCEIVVQSNNFTIEPTHVNGGYSELTLTALPLDDHSMLYGEILLKSKLTRRIYVDGSASSDVQQVVDRLVYSYETVDTSAKSDILPFNVPPVDVKKSIECKTLKRGERTTIECLNLTMHLSHTGTPSDIDPYMFLVDGQNQVIHDENMVFFGNHTSLDFSVCLQDDNSVTVDLNNVSKDVQKVSVCYSIYKGGYSKNFSTVVNPILNIKDPHGNDLYKVPLEDLGHMPTVIVVEFYRYKNSWKINPVVAGYNDGLPKLCQSFGVDADY